MGCLPGGLLPIRDRADRRSSCPATCRPLEDDSKPGTPNVRVSASHEQAGTATWRAPRVSVLPVRLRDPGAHHARTIVPCAEARPGSGAMVTAGAATERVATTRRSHPRLTRPTRPGSPSPGRRRMRRTGRTRAAGHRRGRSDHPRSLPRTRRRPSRRLRRSSREPAPAAPAPPARRPGARGSARPRRSPRRRAGKRARTARAT